MKKFLIADLMKSIGEVDFIEVWRAKGYPEDFSFEIAPSKSTWRRNMHDNPARVEAYPIYESIGSNGEDTPMYYVDVNWPSGSTYAPETKTYEMDLDTLEAWSNNTSGTYFNSNIRGKF